MRQVVIRLVLVGGITLLASCGGAAETGTVAGTASLTGTWDAVLDEADGQWVRDQFRGAIEAKHQQVTVRLGFNGATWWQGFLFDGELLLEDGAPAGDGGPLQLTGDTVVMTGADGTALVRPTAGRGKGTSSPWESWSSAMSRPGRRPAPAIAPRWTRT